MPLLASFREILLDGLQVEKHMGELHLLLLVQLVDLGNQASVLAISLVQTFVSGWAN